MAGKRGYGAGSVSKSSDPKRAKKPWIAQVYKGVNAEGKAQFQRSYHATQREAEKACRGLAEAQEKGELVSPDRRTVADWLRTWLDDVKKARIGPRSYLVYEDAIKCHLAPRLGRVALQKLTSQQVQAFVAAELEEGKATSTVDKSIRVLSAALRQAVKWQLVARNVVDQVERPKVSYREATPFTVEEAREFLRLIKGDRFEALLTVVLALGIRRGEACGIRWRDVDLDRGELRIVVQALRLDHKTELVEPKYGSRRTIHLPAFVVATLRQHRRAQLAARMAAVEWTDNDLVFCQANGEAWNPDVVTTYFNRFQKRHGLRPVRLHDLRHTAVSLLIAAGVQPREIMGIVGHSTIGMTMNLYGHLFAASFESAAVKMDQALGVAAG